MDWQLVLLSVVVALPIVTIIGLAVYGAFIVCVQVTMRRDRRRLAQAMALRRRPKD